MRSQDTAWERGCSLAEVRGILHGKWNDLRILKTRFSNTARRVQQGARCIHEIGW